ncbi:hypothetical protein [Microvirga sp. VF16]|uniref:hypothetical protein n=1 Tax=Microvirga sp. VF16 TaxID=2807101 RepID=UPI00193D879D|nr:hypothetical protein [Microvirga sp. VF16]QRM34752.1 hypothetical protein JO965_41550 [Microvirga sp. VF16]
MPMKLRRFISESLIRRLIPKAKTIMNAPWLGRDDCPVVADDIARARSTLLSVRAKIDSKGHNKVYAYGQALWHVGRLISCAHGVTEADALKARGMTADRMDLIYRDLFSSARRCRTFLQEGTQAFDMADNLATACSILKNLYRMRFHEMKASGSQQVKAGDLAERFMTLSQALCELGIAVPPADWEEKQRLAA